MLNKWLMWFRGADGNDKKVSADNPMPAGVFGLLQDEFAASVAADGSQEQASLTRHREVRTRDQRSQTIQDCNDATDFAGLDDNTANVADSANHLFGSGAVSFDKVNGSANTLIAGIEDDAISLDVGELYESGGFVGIGIYLPSVADVSNVFLRLGSDASNYQEWQWSDDVLSAGRWLPLRNSTNQPSGFAGNGWDTSDISYVAIGVTFDSETDTLAGIVVDNIHFIGGRVTDSTLQASLSSSVNTPNINVHRVAGQPTDANIGNAGPATQRFVLASDQPRPPDFASQATLASLEGKDFATEATLATSSYEEAGHLYLNGSTSASTPDSALLDVTGDLDLRVAGAARRWRPAATEVIAAKWNVTGNNRSFALDINTNGTLLLLWSTSGAGAGVLSATSTAAVPFGAGELGAIRVTLDVNNGASGRTATFYTRRTTPKRAAYDLAEDDGWEQLGDAVVAAGTTSIFSGNAAFILGTVTGGGSNWNARVYSALVKAGIGAAGILGAYVNFSDASEWQADDTTGAGYLRETWTLASGAAIRGIAPTVGVTPHFDADGDNSVQTIKASAGKLHSLSVHNPNGSDAFIQLFDAASPTVGTTTPVQSYYVPPGGGMGVEFPVPMAFATAIKYACTTTATGNTDPTTGLVVNAGYA